MSSVELLRSSQMESSALLTMVPPIVLSWTCQLKKKLKAREEERIKILEEHKVLKSSLRYAQG